MRRFECAFGNCPEFPCKYHYHSAWPYCCVKNVYEDFLQWQTLLILALGLVAFVFDTAGGVFFAKLLNIFLPKGKKINPMIGAAGISAFPMSGRVVNQMGLKEDNQNFLLMQSISVNVSGQIASVIAGGLILTLVEEII